MGMNDIDRELRENIISHCEKLDENLDESLSVFYKEGYTPTLADIGELLGTLSFINKEILNTLKEIMIHKL
jgi:hypothetical protein